jgi:putative ABC transport system substrate-binding protein
MTRRGLVSLLAITAAAWPLHVRAQRFKTPTRIGFLPLGAPANNYDASLVEAFRQGLRQVGLVEGRDVVLDVGWVTTDPDQTVAELVQHGAELLVACGTVASLAAKRRAPSMPMVFISVGNPIGVGLVQNLAHPGGNATGFSDALADVGGKLVEVARELDKGTDTVDYLWHTGWADGQHRLQETERVAETLGMKLRAHAIAGIDEADDAVAAMKNGGATVVIVQPGPFTYQQRQRLIESAARRGLPTIFAFPEAARDGALVAYGPDYVHMYQRAPLYVDRILQGIRPADLPVEEPARFELMVNLRTAKQLGLEVPLSLLIRADELID